MKGFVQDIEGLAIKNDEFRRVLYTAKHCQLVVMALKPKEEIGAEVHQLDQFFRVEEGSGEVILDGVRTAIQAGFAVIVPAGTKHNIINTGSVSLKLYTPPNHRDGVVHHTRDDAEADNEHFDGKTQFLFLFIQLYFHCLYIVSNISLSSSGWGLSFSK